MRSLLAALDRIERGVIAPLAAIALLLACNAMASRYLLPGLALDWTFEVIIFMVIWAVWLASARLITTGNHIRIDILLRALGPGGRRWLGLFAAVLGLGVAGLLVWSGYLVVTEAYSWDERTSSTLRLPLWIYYLCLPVGAASMFIRLIERVVFLLRGGEEQMH